MSFLTGQSLFRGSFTFDVYICGQIISSLYRGKLIFRSAIIGGLPVTTLFVWSVLIAHTTSLISFTVTLPIL